MSNFFIDLLAERKITEIPAFEDRVAFDTLTGYGDRPRLEDIHRGKVVDSHDKVFRWDDTLEEYFDALEDWYEPIDSEESRILNEIQERDPSISRNPSIKDISTADLIAELAARGVPVAMDAPAAKRLFDLISINDVSDDKVRSEMAPIYFGDHFKQIIPIAGSHIYIDPLGIQILKNEEWRVLITF